MEDLLKTYNVSIADRPRSSRRRQDEGGGGAGSGTGSKIESRSGVEREGQEELGRGVRGKDAGSDADMDLEGEEEGGEGEEGEKGEGEEKEGASDNGEASLSDLWRLLLRVFSV